MNLLMRYTPDLDREDHRSWEWYYLVGCSNHSRLEWQAHKTDANSIAWGPDGSRLATVANDATLMIWDAETGKQLERFHLGSTITICVAWHPEGHQLAWGSASDEAVVRIWDEKTGEIETLDANTESIWSIQWNKAGDRLLVGGMNALAPRVRPSLVLWGRSEGAWKSLAENSLPRHIRSADWNSTEDQIVACSLLDTVYLLDAETLTVIKEFPSIPRPLHHAWHPTIRHVAVGCETGECCLLEVDNDTVLQRFQAHVSGVEHVEWNRDGSRLATCGRDGLVKIWDATDWSLTDTFSGHDGTVSSLVWSPDDDRLASIGTDGFVVIWELTARSPTELPTLRGGYQANRFAWTADNLIRSVANSPMITDVDPRRGNVVRAIPLEQEVFWTLFDRNLIADLGRKSVIRPGAAFLLSQDGKLVATDAVIRDDSRNANACSHPNAQSFALVEHWLRRPTLFHADGSESRVLGCRDFVQIRQLSWAPDGKKIAIVGGGLQTDDGTLAHMGWLHLIDPSNDSDFVRTQVGQNRNNASAVAWSSDSQQIAAATMDGICQVMEATDLRRVLRKRIHDGMVSTLGWHPDGTRVASGGDDQVLKIWDSTTGEVLLEIPLEGKLMYVEWSPDGTMLAAKENTGAIRVWDAASGYDFVNAGRLTTRRNRERILDAKAARIDGYSLYQQGRWDQAIEAYRKVIELDPGNASDLASLGATLNQKGDEEEAIKIYRKAIELDPLSPSPYRSFGHALVMRNRMNEAIPFFQKSTELDPIDYASHLYLALLHLSANDHASYRATCQRMLDKFQKTNKPSAAGFTAWTCALMDHAIDDYTSAIRLARLAVDRMPDDQASLTFLGAILMRSGNYSEAIRKLEAAIAVPTSHNASPVYARYFAAMTEQRLDNKEAAKQHLQVAIDLSETQPHEESTNWIRSLTLRLLREEAEEPY